VFQKRDLDLSLENIGTYMLPKMRANIMAGRKDSAIAVGMKIIECYDSALTRQKQDATAELATVYNTRGKERQIAEQQMRISKGRVSGLIVAIITLTVFFAVIDIYRRKSAKRLAKVNAAKERMEGELSIARNIQMSMVPHTFPKRDDFDMYAMMTPAKEVGGDLYSYLIQGDILYFCVGDVSGKGVPASLFMAQTTRLFHALASQGMSPAEICTHMNDELTEDNEQSMFVTMFICRLDMKLNLFEYCNAGHNPPVIGNADGQLSFIELEANAPLGLWPGLAFVGESIDYFKDRLLFLYTDGLNEAEDTEQKQFGEDRLLDILHQTHTNSAKQIIEALTQEVDRHRNGAKPNDDLTMMCVKL
jgi:serine phosphatase RsbU (regulator of sigma subunit)